MMISDPPSPELKADSARSYRTGAVKAGTDTLVVVGIGASAGGLEAIQDLLAGLSPDGGRAYVLVQHLDPDHQSLLPELLSKRTAVPIAAIEDGMPVKRGTFFLIPSGVLLTIENGIFRLASFDTPRGLRRPIDVFFQSLARDRGGLSACIILSGTGSDGATGARAVKEAGGLVLVQDPEEAKYDGMPNSAIATNAVDLVLPAGEMPGVLDDYFTRKSDLDSVGTDNDIVERVINHIRYRTGHDFSQYKKATLTRRLARRMSIVGVQSPQEYLQRLVNNHNEATRLFHDILINVTSFFRDPKTFDTLRQTAIAEIVATKSDDDEIRVWVPGCSTGQEAYTIAILLAEELSRSAKHPKVCIFATDIDSSALQFAREAVYPNSIAAEVPAPLLQRYFTSSLQGYSVNESVREMIRWSRHDLVKDPPFSKIDLISCRNLLIYFEDELQEQTLRVFRYALRPDGFLSLGPSESVGRSAGEFEPLGADRMFRRGKGPPPPLPLPFMKHVIAPRAKPPPASRAATEGELTASYENAVLARHTPPFVVVNERRDVVFSSGRTSRFLELPRGRSQLDLLELAKDDLRPALRTLLLNPPAQPGIPVHRAFDSRIEGIPVRIMLSAEILADNNMLIVFQDRFDPTRDAQEPGTLLPPAHSTDEQHIRELETQLEIAQQTIRTTVEELETSNEELKSSNEEMMSMNEELQSTNEELSTANDELNNKIAELNVLNDDQRNLAESSRIATLFLDANLYIRSFTPETTKYFRLEDRDIGRPFDDIASNLSGDPIVDVCRRTLKTGKAGETERSALDGEVELLIRTYPYITKFGAAAGVVVTLTDVTELRRYSEQLEETQASARLRLIEIEELYRVTPQAKALLDRSYRFLRVNQRMAEINGLTIADHIGKRAVDLVPELSAVIFDSARRVFENGEPVTSNEVALSDAKGERRVWDIDWYPVRRDDDIYAVGINIRDVTAYKTMEVELRRLMRELQHRVKNMLASVTALVNRARREKGEPSVTLETLVERIRALAATHNLLTVQDWRPTSFTDVLQLELTAVYGEDRIFMKGPSLFLNAKSTLALSMAIHELATNAAKYGSLSSPDGHLSVQWSRMDEGEGENVVLHWREGGGPRVEAPTTSGFGTQLIRTTIERSLGGKYECRHPPSGFDCTIILPYEKITQEETDAAEELEAVEGSLP